MTYIAKEDYKIKDVLSWWHEQWLSTTKKLYFKGKWRRVYCRIHSNIQTEYIIHNKQEVILV